MKMRGRIFSYLSLGLVFLGSLFAVNVGFAANSEAKPNVIFILMDDMGYSDVSCYGAKTVKTPNIDQLAAEGLQFTNFHTGASICSPSRAAFLTGAYPQRCGLYMGINCNRQAHWFLGLNPEEITLAEQFKKQGYATSIVGKWHLGSEPEFSYFEQGFDNYYGAPSNIGHDPRFYDGKELVYTQTPLEKMTKLYTDRMTKLIKESGEQPFFIYYSHNYPHTPYKASKKFQGTSQGGVRGDMIQEIDWSIGEIIKALEAAGKLENTMVIFTSDNGPTSNKFALPYSGTKYVSLEGGHRVPFIMYWKNGIQKPAVLDTDVNAMDVFPTLSEMIGEALPADRVYDGVSLSPLFAGGQITRDSEDPFFYYNCENLQALRIGDWKLHLPRKREQLPFWAQKKQNPIDAPQLYNLAAEKSEKTDLAEQYPEKVSAMMTLADETRLKLGEFMKRGSEQRATGSKFPEVPIFTNQSQDWDQLPDEVKGRAKTQFENAVRYQKPKKKRNK